MGTSKNALPKILFQQDHPHAYGDKLQMNINTDRNTGSSPRVWGQGKTAFGLLTESRIIPTRMGTRFFAF